MVLDSMSMEPGEQKKGTSVQNPFLVCQRKASIPPIRFLMMLTRVAPKRHSPYKSKQANASFEVQSADQHQSEDSLENQGFDRELGQQWGRIQGRVTHVLEALDYLACQLHLDQGDLFITRPGCKSFVLLVSLQHTKAVTKLKQRAEPVNINQVNDSTFPFAGTLTKGASLASIIVALFNLKMGVNDRRSPLLQKGILKGVTYRETLWNPKTNELGKEKYQNMMVCEYQRGQPPHKYVKF